jgi:16S rRNA (uracil1498-N3)-methyltransferase
MKRILCPQLPKPHRPVTLHDDEANHVVRVLRLRDGDSVEAIDGQGHSAPAILRMHGGPPRLELATAPKDSPHRAAQASARTEAPGAVVPLTLEMAVLKGDAMEWVVEKAVELGVRTLVPVVTAHTVVQLKAKGPEAFRERWQKIADQALKQCGRLERLEIALPVGLEERVRAEPRSAQSPRYWCDEAAGPGAADLPSRLASLRPGGFEEVRLLIGPEGGWSEEERQWLAPAAERIQLGPLILRAETAAIYGISQIVAALRGANLLTKTHG